MPVQTDFTCKCGAKCRILADVPKGFSQLEPSHVRHCAKGEEHLVPGHFIELQERREGDGQWVTVQKKQQS